MNASWRVSASRQVSCVVCSCTHTHVIFVVMLIVKKLAHVASCTLTACFFLHVSWSSRNFFVPLLLYNCVLVCVLVFATVYSLFCCTILLLLMCELSVNGFGVRVSFTQVAIQCFPLVLFFP